MNYRYDEDGPDHWLEDEHDEAAWADEWDDEGLDPEDDDN